MPKTITIGQAAYLLEQFIKFGFIYHGEKITELCQNYSYILDKIYSKKSRITEAKKSYFLNLVWNKKFVELEKELDNLI